MLGYSKPESSFLTIQVGNLVSGGWRLSGRVSNLNKQRSGQRSPAGPPRVRLPLRAASGDVKIRADLRLDCFGIRTDGQEAFDLDGDE